jgi:hypothetical protein
MPEAAGGSGRWREGMSHQYWAIWYPKALATGLLVARSFLDSTDSVLLHAAPEVITVEVSDAEEGRRLAIGEDLEMTQTSPMCRLRVEGGSVVREDVWPTQADIGARVILPGGEAGILKSWWHADDKKERRWEVEFYNITR